jgi:lysophospholipase L1-like esterase
MKWFLAVGGTVLLLVAGFFFFDGTPDIPKPTREGPIVAFGDSLVYGIGSSRGGFVKILEESIGEPIVNKGVPGDTTESGLLRLGEVIALKPRIVIVLLGGNDYLKRVPHDETFANLASIIERLQNDGAAVLLLGVRGGVLRDNFAERYEMLAEEYNTAYVHDVLEETLGAPGYMDDQIHPNDRGYRVIADRIQPVLAAMLE